MALSRRTGARFQASIWPGFVDAMTGLLLVLMFVLTIFMIVQFVLREEITGQASKLDTLSAEVAALSLALGLERDRSGALQDRVGALTATLSDARTREEEQAALIETLRQQANEQDEALEAARGRITTFEEQVAGLLSERALAEGRIADLEGERETLLSEQEQLQLALAGLRDEVDAQAEAARLDAARRAALEALAEDLRRGQAEAIAAQEALAERLSEEERARLVEAEAAAALRKRLEGAEAELTSMTLALEEQRRRAEETLTLLAATQTARDDLDSRLAQALLKAEAAEDLERDVQETRAQLVAALAAQRAAEADAAEQMSAAETRAALLAEARARLAEESEMASAAQKEQALLNQQVAALRQQLAGLQALLDDAKERDAATEVQLQSLGNELNTALARVAAEERRRREAEEGRRQLLEAEAERLAAEKEDLEKYRSEFFGRLRDVLGQQEGVRIVGDRFVFSSEVLFAPGEARLSPSGAGEIAKVAGILLNVIDAIPEGIDWVLQVDGHTDTVPIVGGAQFADNWELSQARALSVVRYLTDVLGFPPDRLSANGFGEFQPINPAETPEARAQNRRIELKLTGK